MIFELKNIGSINKATIKLDGITVICGNNNTGKSTVGKVLFSFYNSLYDYKVRIADKKLSDIDERILNKGKKVVEEILKNDMSIIDENIRIKGKKAVEEILTLYQLSDDAILNELVLRYFNMVMNDEVIRKDKKATAKSCSVKAKFRRTVTNELSFADDKWTCNIEEPITHKAYYINSPFVLDHLNNPLIDISSLSLLERNAIEAIRNAQAELNADAMSNIFEAVSNKNDLKEVKDVLQMAYSGETRFVDGKYVYVDENGLQVDFRSISAGLKSFALIERLLEGGVLKKKDVLILDEPEIHLHTEWQIYYAELIVALQKKFDLTILLVTHSFQFLESLNFFMKKYGITDRGNYYIPEKMGNGKGFVMSNSEDNLEKIKLNLSTGTFRIADLEFEYDMEQDNG